MRQQQQQLYPYVNVNEMKQAVDWNARTKPNSKEPFRGTQTDLDPRKHTEAYAM